jgi:hypothetical protein
LLKSASLREIVRSFYSHRGASEASLGMSTRAMKLRARVYGYRRLHQLADSFFLQESCFCALASLLFSFQRRHFVTSTLQHTVLLKLKQEGMSAGEVAHMDDLRRDLDPREDTNQDREETCRSVKIPTRGLNDSELDSNCIILFTWSSIY